MINPRKRYLEEEKAAAEKKQKVIQPQRPQYGLYNQGATCYLNSVLQVLFKTAEIHDRLDPESQITDRELRNIFKKLKKTTCGTEDFTQSLEIKDVYQQRDAAECLEMILRKVSQQAAEVFQGQLKYTTKCSKDHILNEETKPFWTLPLSLKDGRDTNYSVDKGFEKIFQIKSFSEDNMLYCNDCEEKTEGTSGCEMVVSPQILTLLLKRFDFDYNTMSDVKSDRCVDVPCVLQTEDKTYKLYGMVNHKGSLRGGHYTAIMLSTDDDTWYEFDDTLVSMVEEQPFAKTKTYNSSTAYLLVYRGRLRDQMKEPQDDTSYSNKPYPDNGTKAEERKLRSNIVQDKDSPQPRRSPANIMKNPLMISLIVLGCVLFVILLAVLTTLNKH